VLAELSVSLNENVDILFRQVRHFNFMQQEFLELRS